MRESEARKAFNVTGVKMEINMKKSHTNIKTDTIEF